MAAADPYRIGLTGAQGTGKSTLAREIVQQLREAGVADLLPCEGLGAHLQRAGFVVGAQAGADTVRRFAQAHVDREATARGAVQVFDRCLLDTLAYAQVLGCLPADEFQRLREATAVSARRFAQLLWLRVTHDYPVAGAADETPAFRRAIDSAVGRLAQGLGLALVECTIPPQRTSALAAQVLHAFRDAHEA